MSERPVAVGDLVLVRFEVTHRLNDGYLIMTSPGRSAITIHEDDVATVHDGLSAKHPRLGASRSKPTVSAALRGDA